MSRLAVTYSAAAFLVTVAAAFYFAGPIPDPRTLLVFAIFILALRSSAKSSSLKPKTRAWTCSLGVFLALVSIVGNSLPQPWWWRVNLSSKALSIEAEKCAQQANLDYRCPYWIGFVPIHGYCQTRNFVEFETHFGLFTPYGVALRVIRPEQDDGLQMDSVAIENADVFPPLRLVKVRCIP